MSLRHLAICLLLTLLPLQLAADELPPWIAIGPDGGNVQALAVSPALPSWVLAGVPHGYGIFKSADRGTSWGAATGVFGRNVLALAIGADGKAFYAATSRGLLKSTNGGARWPALDPTPDVYTLVAAHPSKAAIVFAVRGSVLLRSANGGVTRTAAEGPQGVVKIAFAQSGRRNVVVYAGAANGLWKSSDDGRTWSDESPSLSSPPHVEAVAVDPRNPQILYIGLRQGSRVLLKSLNGGATWRLSQSGLPAAEGMSPTVSELAVDPKNSSIVHAVVGGELFRSTNGGREWSRPSPQPPGGAVNALEATGYGLLAGTPAGFLLSTDQGITWQLRIAGLTATSIAGIAIDQQEPPRLYAATSVPLGIHKTASRGRPWLRLGTPASPTTSDQPLAVDPVNPNIVYAGTVNGVAKSTNGGRRWTTPSPNACLTFGRFTLDPRKPSHLFAFAWLKPPCLDPYRCTFFRSLDAGESWECLGSALNFNGGTLQGIDPFTSALYGRASVFGVLERSTDDGATWDFVSSTWLGISFAVSPLVEGTLWSGFTGAVMRSRDGGQTWELFSTGLPYEPVLTLAPDPADPATLYAATPQSGVFKSNDAGETWSPAGRWPSGILYRAGLLIDPKEPGIVYAGTEGLGVLRLDQNGN